MAQMLVGPSKQRMPIIVSSFDHLVCSLMNIFAESEAICHFYARAITRMRKAWFHLRMSSFCILFAAKHSWTTLRIGGPLFVGSYL